ncbi:E3 ubiquitin-protein ligase MPSR1-like isoform X2 [Homalodisca vitripennis]|uniref:E3 ubiquitin-protein ligase MPSR1-like isoform X2 n=1 Tax=Homalodisca vitripennis TaxID=197043 RepID=UPI001EEB320E|nr:E3 ubiquitin-protein ligase MPSR1-like isoform X2 [Homalodisca vitripennis]
MQINSRKRRKNDNQCVICFEEFITEYGCKRLPCNHKFHSQCIGKWLLVQKTCPTCRKNVI